MDAHSLQYVIEKYIFMTKYILVSADDIVISVKQKLTKHSAVAYYVRTSLYI